MWLVKKRELERQEHEAEKAVETSLKDYKEMLKMQEEADRIEKGHRKIQQENEFSRWLFGGGHAA